MFRDILEFTVENKKYCLRKTVVKMWSQICNKKAYVSTKILLEKRATNKKRKEKKHKHIHILWRILGTKLVPLVDF